MDNSTYTWIAKAQAGDEAALEYLTKTNTPLIRSVAMRFLGRGMEADDLFQVGAIGFIKAVRAFDLTRGLELSTYAVPMIMGEVRRQLRDHGLIKVSRGLKETAARAAVAMQTLSEASNGEVSLSALAAHLAIAPEELATALAATKTPDSLDRPIGDGEGLLLDKIPLKEDMAEKATDRVTLCQLLRTGNETERKVILYRYFKDKTQAETAQLLGLSQVQVSRAEKKAVSRLRAHMLS